MKTLDEQLALFTEPLSKWDKVDYLTEDFTPSSLVDLENDYPDCTPDLGLWNYDSEEFVFVPLNEWVNFQAEHKGLNEEDMSRAFFAELIKTYDIVPFKKSDEK